MPLNEICSFHTMYCSTTSAAPVEDGCRATLAPGQAAWFEVRVKAVSPTRSWYAAISFFVRRPISGPMAIYKTVLASAEPEGKTKWAVNLVEVAPNDVLLTVTGAAGQSINWAVSSRGFDNA